MRKPFYYFADVTLLVTHYNRSSSLERLLKAFQDLNCGFEQVIISDDCSKPEHFAILHTLQQRHGFELVTTPQNRGLGHNINKGQDAVKTPYTLYVQEDFIPTSAFAEHFQEALNIMKKDPVWDIITFYAYIAYPYLRPYKQGFAEKLYKPWFTNYQKIYCYTDHPHLRRSNFLTKFGRYVESIKSDKTEYLMCISFIQNKGKSLFYTNFQSLFFQENSIAEPSTVKRSKWRQSDNLIISSIRSIYRQIKYNYDLLFLQ